MGCTIDREERRRELELVAARTQSSFMNASMNASVMLLTRDEDTKIANEAAHWLVRLQHDASFRTRRAAVRWRKRSERHASEFAAAKALSRFFADQLPSVAIDEALLAERSDLDCPSNIVPLHPDDADNALPQDCDTLGALNRAERNVFFDRRRKRRRALIIVAASILLLGMGALWMHHLSADARHGVVRREGSLPGPAGPSGGQ